MNDYVKALLGSFGENNRYIKTLLREKSIKINEVQSVMDRKARTKTPLDERQVRNIHEFAGLCTQEGGILQQSLMSIENTIRISIETHHYIHTENTEGVLMALATLHRHQNKAIHSLRRMIASSENTLKLLNGAVA
jgi:hypothetical protein